MNGNLVHILYCWREQVNVKYLNDNGLKNHAWISRRIWKWTENVWLLKMDGKNPRNDILIPGGVKCIDSKSYLHQGNQT